MLYYRVVAKCGHVGRNKFILKNIYVKAGNGKDAAKIVRVTPRVKHHHKDAIREVKEITYDEYHNGLKEMNEDMYFKVSNSVDQKLLCYISENDIYSEFEKISFKKNRHGRYLRLVLLDKEWRKQLQGGFLYE